MKKSFRLRVRSLAPVVFAVSIIVFLLPHLAPGDPVTNSLGVGSSASTPEETARIEERLGFDRPLPVQYVLWLGEIARGDFGESLVLEREIRGLVIQRTAATLLLVVAAMLVALPLGVSAGAITAKGGRGSTRFIDAAVLVVGAAPGFVIGLVSIALLAVVFPILPVGGTATFGGGDPLDRLRHLVLPAVSLGLGAAVPITRWTDAALRANRDRPVSMMVRALLPRIVGQGGVLLGGAVTIELLFNWPGLGRMTVKGIQQYDLLVVQAGVLTIAVLATLADLAADLLASLLHTPRLPSPAPETGRVAHRLLHRNPAVIVALTIVVLSVGAAAVGPVLGLNDPHQVDPTLPSAPIARDGQLLGTDQFGRDLFARLVWGARTTLLLGVGASALSTVIGVACGAIARRDERSAAIIRWVVDVLRAFPSILLPIVAIAMLGIGVGQALVALTLFGLPGAIDGAHHLTGRHPSISDVVRIAVGQSGPMIVAASGLGLLGLTGASLELGALVAEGLNQIAYTPRIALVPAVAIVSLTLACDLLGARIGTPRDGHLR